MNPTNDTIALIVILTLTGVGLVCEWAAVVVWVASTQDAHAPQHKRHRR